MNRQKLFSVVIASLLAGLGCSPSIQKNIAKHEQGTGGTLPVPKKANHNVVAHRGGSMEKNCPDNSIEALNYAIELGCYASECDIYITKDNQVVVAHADRNNKINGLHPWEATYEQIASAAKLPNGETIPKLEDYLDRVLEAGTTILWIDVKSFPAAVLPTEQGDEYTARAAERAAEIVRQKKADRFVEFILVSDPAYKRAVAAVKGAWPCGHMWYRFSPSDFRKNGYKWANFSNTAVFYHNGKVKGDYTIEDYLKAGIEVSIYHVDSEMDRVWYVPKAKSLYALTTNYPKALIEAIQTK